MPNSLKCRLKRLARQGLLSEKDLSRIYTDNDVVEELEKIWEEIRALPDINPDYQMDRTIHISRYGVQEIIDKHISELKGE